MTGRSGRAAVTALGATAIALSGYVSPELVLLAVLVGVVLFALGWARLIDLPTTRGPAAVLIGAGTAALAAVRLADVGTVTVVTGLAVIAAFVHQMLRRDGRPRLVESISGVVSGTVVVVSAALWVATDVGPGGEPLVVTGAAAVAVAAACTAVPLGPSVVATLATLLAGATGLGAGYLLPDAGWPAGAVVGLGVGVLTSALHILVGRFPQSAHSLPAVSAAMIPLLVGAVPVYLVSRVLAG